MLFLYVLPPWVSEAWRVAVDLYDYIILGVEG